MIHLPVLTTELLDLFQPKSGDILLDATLGQGGHALAYLAASPTSLVVGLDADPAALKVAADRLAAYRSQIILINTNFAYLKDSLTGGGILATKQALPPLFTHILFDLGIGSHQLADPTRGFSFQTDAPLDMSYGPLEKLPPASLPTLNFLARRLGKLPTAADLVLHLSPNELAEVLRSYGEERYAGRIARGIKRHLPQTSEALVTAILSEVPAAYRRARLHPATRTFQALRLAVNRELEALAAALPQAFDLLSPDGTLAIISFHSLEDRIVKQYFKQRAKSGDSRLLTKKPITPGKAEISTNPRARSAKLRAIRKT